MMMAGASAVQSIRHVVSNRNPALSAEMRASFEQFHAGLALAFAEMLAAGSVAAPR
jgi:hypothetical protein